MAQARGIELENKTKGRLIKELQALDKAEAKARAREKATSGGDKAAGKGKPRG